MPSTTLYKSFFFLYLPCIYIFLFSFNPFYQIIQCFPFAHSTHMDFSIVCTRKSRIYESKRYVNSWVFNFLKRWIVSAGDLIRTSMLLLTLSARGVTVGSSSGKFCGTLERWAPQCTLSCLRFYVLFAWTQPSIGEMRLSLSFFIVGLLFPFSFLPEIHFCQ